MGFVRRFGDIVGVAVLRRRGKDRGQEIAELAALADGSIAPKRRASLEKRVATSEELGERLAEQERALTLTRGVGAQVAAPGPLRTRVEAQRRKQRAGATRRTMLIGAGFAGVAILAAAIGLTVLRSGASGARFDAELASTVLALGATGEATFTKTQSGWRIELAAKGLPRLGHGRFYEAWLRNRAGVLVPIGTFNDGRNVTLWAGVPPNQFSTMTVTRERADGAQASSGEKVLVGTVRADSR